MTEATAAESCKVGGVWQQLDMESLRNCINKLNYFIFIKIPTFLV